MNKPCLDICIRPKIHDRAFATLQSLQPVRALSKPTSSAERQSPRPRVPMTAHQVQVEGFWIDEHDVTNAEFAKFVTATGYVTTAEKSRIGMN
jgi:formylglycine-generating enzyme required for sulfatase activity